MTNQSKQAVTNTHTHTCKWHYSSI